MRTGLLHGQSLAVHHPAVHGDRHVKARTAFSICHPNGLRHLVGKFAAVRESIKTVDQNNQFPGLPAFRTSR
jgi:hypothetical protein